MKKLHEWTDTELFSFVNYENIVFDLGLIVVSIIYIKKTCSGPRFVVKGLLLVLISCIVDALYQAGCIHFTHPSFEKEIMLYTLTGLNTFLDVSIYWIIAFMYWITAINIAEFN